MIEKEKLAEMVLLFCERLDRLERERRITEYLAVICAVEALVTAQGKKEADEHHPSVEEATNGELKRTIRGIRERGVWPPDIAEPTISYIRGIIRQRKSK